MGERASGSGPAPDSAEATRQFALEFVRSSGSECGVAYGPTTTMRKRESSAKRRVGSITTPSERVRKTSASKRNLAAVPSGRPATDSETAEEALARMLRDDSSRAQSNPVPIQPRFHRAIADLPAVEVPASAPGRPAFIGDRPPTDPVANTGVRDPLVATNGQPDSPPAAARGKAATGRPPYRSPPAGMGPPTPAPPGPFRPPGAPPPGPLPVLIQDPTTTCPQCPIYVTKILELNARHTALEEDKDDLR
eukprot:7704468-Heterocapsa_arctica.AAC.1